jgi:hypothetical protein
MLYSVFFSINGTHVFIEPFLGDCGSRGMMTLGGDDAQPSLSPSFPPRLTDDFTLLASLLWPIKIRTLVSTDTNNSRTDNRNTGNNNMVDNNNTNMDSTTILHQNSIPTLHQSSPTRPMSRAPMKTMAGVIETTLDKITNMRPVGRRLNPATGMFLRLWRPNP